MAERDKHAETSPVDGQRVFRYSRATTMLPQPTIKQLPKSQVEFGFSVSVEDAKPYIDQAIIDISTNRPIKGFRPGKATYNDVKLAYGEMFIWESALERIVRATYVKAVLDGNIDAVGSPEIHVEKLVPGNDIVFSVTATVMPSATKLADYTKTVVTKKHRDVTEEEVTHAVEDLRKMRRIESVVDRPATKEDLAVVDLEILKDGVSIEGGQSHDYRVYMFEDHYIPGFADQLIGAKKGDEKSFELPFPEDHYNKLYAGQNMTFKTNVKDVYEMALPEVTDEFAKGLGAESKDALIGLIRKNLQEEEDRRTDESAEIQMLQKLTKECAYTEIPDILINEEIRRMTRELEHSVEERGGTWKDYLSSIKKSADDLKLEFVPQAIERIQTAVFMKEVGKKENITVEHEEIHEEIDRILATVKEGDTKTKEMVMGEEYHDYIGAQLKNRKILKLLKEKTIATE